jgi:hypothetical protein
MIEMKVRHMKVYKRWWKLLKKWNKFLQIWNKSIDKTDLIANHTLKTIFNLKLPHESILKLANII